MYNANDWTKAGGWKYFFSQPSFLPGDEGAELFERSKQSDYGYKYNKFKDSPI
jgi:hypothetical protein